MKEEIRFRCPLRGGLHARPASQLVEVAGHFSAAIELLNERTGERGNAKSVVAVIALDVRGGDPCRLLLDGSDAAAARMALERQQGATEEILTAWRTWYAEAIDSVGRLAVTGASRR